MSMPLPFLEQLFSNKVIRFVVLGKIFKCFTVILYIHFLMGDLCKKVRFLKIGEIFMYSCFKLLQ